MPLLKKMPFTLVELPKDLKPHELVYQVRFTKEIFRDYNEYLNRMNLYRQRVWMCKVSGKINLTYEEALVSEKCATEKVQQLPKELVVPALRIIQYSMLSLKDLADTIAEELQDCLFAGAELNGKKDNNVYSCKILKVLEEGDAVRYEVGWLDRNKEVIGTSVLNQEDFIPKKFPFSRNVLKSFIRESTYRSAPWVLHDKLAQSNMISTDVPEDLRSTVSFQYGLVICNKKRRKSEEDKYNVEVQDEEGNCKKKKVVALITGNTNVKGDDQEEEEPIKYPIDDLLLKPSEDDPVFTNRHVPSSDFNIPMEFVGDLLMVWNFCSSYGRLLHLLPYSLKDFENAVCHKDSTVGLLVETHSALLRLLIKDNGEFLLGVKKRNRKLKITWINWTEYLCDWLEMINIPELCSCMGTIKQGHYGLLDAYAKIRIFRELVNHALDTNIFKEKLDEFVEQRQVLGATIRGEALEEARKKREEKERLKSIFDANGVTDTKSVEDASANGYVEQSEDKLKKINGETLSALKNQTLVKSSDRNSGSSKMVKKHNVDSDNVKESSGQEASKQLKDDKKELTDRRNKKQRREYYERETEKCPICTNPLGKDRYRNRYWWFRRDGRMFVESSNSKQWGYYCRKEELDALMGSLNCKGERERALKKQLEKFYGRISSEMQKRSKDLANEMAMDEAVLRRSTRVRAPPRENPAKCFLRYVNKWKED